MLNPYLQVAIGGAIGSVARYSVYRLMPMGGSGFPWATLGVNVVGSFLMGILAALLTARLGDGMAPLLATGLLGGFTTFSAFSLDVVTLWERGQATAAAGYVLASLALCLVAVAAGLAVARGFFA